MAQNRTGLRGGGRAADNHKIGRSLSVGTETLPNLAFDKVSHDGPLVGFFRNGQAETRMVQTVWVSKNGEETIAAARRVAKDAGIISGSQETMAAGETRCRHDWVCNRSPRTRE